MLLDDFCPQQSSIGKPSSVYTKGNGSCTRKSTVARLVPIEMKKIVLIE